MNRAVFIDKDGTLIPDIPYNVDPKLIELDPSTPLSLKRVHDNGYLLILVSNQSGVARGFFSEDKLNDVVAKIQSDLSGASVQLDDFYFCPHHPEGQIEKYSVDCDCRKPKPGMIVRAASKHNIELSRSWMVGDILNDIEAGNRAGCRTILVDNGNETEWIYAEFRNPSKVVRSLSEAMEFILEQQ
jgi:D-glycero-D-manno-heptose 1,7-bisphosphate phosphatase